MTKSSKGLESLVGQVVTFFCTTYIYTGKLVSISKTSVKLTKASIVYETGAFTEGNWKDAQGLPHDVYIMLSSVESFMILK